MDSRIALEHEMIAVEAETELHVMLELVVPETPSDAERTPLRLAIALDRSGSMHGPRIETARRAARYLVERLSEQDTVAVVAYDDDVELVVPMSAPAVEEMTARIAGVQPGGMTNLSGGWLKALEEAGRHDDGVRRVLLLTDGHANQGVTSPQQLASIASHSAERGVSTTTVGLGAGFAEELLTQLGDAGGGGSWYAQDADDLPRIFAEEFDDLVSLAAQNVSVEIRPNEDVDLVAVLNDYPSVGVDGGVQVQVGDAFGGQRLRVVFRLGIPAMQVLGAAQVAEVVLRYVTVGDEVVSHTHTLPVVVNAVDAAEAAGVAADPEVHDEVVVLGSARAADEARRLADAGDLDAASEVLDVAIGNLRDVAIRSSEGGALTAKAEELARAKHDLDHETFDAGTSKRLHYSSKDIKRNRRRG